MLATAGTGQPLTCYKNHVWRPAPPGESDGPKNGTSCCSTITAPNSSADVEHRDVAPLYPLRRVPERLPISSKTSVATLTHGLSARSVRSSRRTCAVAGLETSFQREFAFAARQPRRVRLKIDLHHHLLQNRRNAAVQQPTLKEQIGFQIVRATGESSEALGVRKKNSHASRSRCKTRARHAARPRLSLDAKRATCRTSRRKLSRLVEETEMTEREKILARVREALKVTAPLPGSHGETHLPASAKNISTARQWLPKSAKVLRTTRVVSGKMPPS